MGITVLSLQVVASQDWPEVTKYAGLVCAQAHRQELIEDLYKERKDPQGRKASGGMIQYVYSSIRLVPFLLVTFDIINLQGTPPFL